MSGPGIRDPGSGKAPPVPGSRVPVPDEGIELADFILPNLGDGVAQGDVLKVLVKAGDAVAVDQPVLELETDKATIEVPSNVAGKITEVKVKAGDKVKPGQAVLTLEGGNGASGASGAKEQTPAEAPKQEAPKQEAPKQEAQKPEAASAPPQASQASAPERQDRKSIRLNSSH